MLTHSRFDNFSKVVKSKAYGSISIIILLLSVLNLAYATDTITTVVGDGTSGYAGDGKDAAKDGRINQPRNIFVDSKGNLYLADTANHVIRRVDTSGILTTIAGTGGQPGFSGDGDLATAALLNFPTGVALDSQGNIYIADAGNQVIRKVEVTTNKIATIAGQGGKPGYAGDGQAATTAQLNNPIDLMVDNANNLYLVDSGNHVIRKIDNLNDADATKRLITTIAGGSPVTDTITDTPTLVATAAKLNSPQGLALDKSGSVLYIADMVNNRVLKVLSFTDPDPTKRLVAKIAGGGSSGLGDGGLAIAAQLSNPNAVALDSQGNIYIADTSQHRIRKIDASGIISTFAGTGEPNYGGDGGVASSAKLNGPKGIAFDSQNNLYIADTSNQRIRKITHTDDSGGTTFALTITTAGSGKGTITASAGTGSGINCGQVCTDSYANNTVVALLATPETGSTFTGWSGTCIGTSATLSMTITATTTCVATFDLPAQPSSLSFVEAQKNNVAGVTGLQGVTSVAVSHDGQFVYATGYFDNAVAVFSRDSFTGKLTFSQIIQDGINNIKNLQGANAIAVSPDDRNVYVTGAKSNAVVVLNRDLTLVQFQENDVNGVTGLDGASAIVVSANGQRVYVTGTRDNALTVFARDPNSGLLTFLQTQQDGVNNITGLGGATSVAVTHNVTTPTDIYVASNIDNTIVAFRSNPAVGELTFIGEFPNLAQNVNMSGVYGVLVSPDDNHVYAVVRGAVVAFIRDPNTGALTYQGRYAGKASGISGFSGTPMAITPDGSELYVTSIDDNALTIFGRNLTTGALVFKNSILNNTGSLDSLDGALGVAVAPEGKQVYTAALRSHALSLFSGMAIDLAITMTDNPDPVAINSPLTYLITVSNQGTDTAPEVVLTDTLPASAKALFTAATPSQGTCQSPSADGLLSCQLGSIEKDKSVTIEIKVTTATAVQGKQDKLVNKATVTTSQVDNNKTNNLAQSETTVMESVPEAELALAVTTEPAAESVSFNSVLTYILAITNNGPATVSNTVLTNTLPTGVIFNAAGSDPRCQATVGPAAESLVTCELGTGEIGGTTEVKIQVTTPSTPGTLTFSSSVKGTETDTIPANNQVTKTTTLVEAVATDLEVVDALADPNTLGVSSQQTIVYKVTVRNNGSTAVDGVTLTSSVWPSKQVSYVSDTAGCNFNTTDNLVCNLGTLTAAETKTVNIQAKPLEPGLDIPLQFKVSSTATDSTSNNDAKTAILNISGQVANIVVSIADSMAGKAAAVDNPITYTITVNNNGPNAVAPSLNIELALSKNDVLLTESTATDGTCQAGTTSASLTCSLNPLLPNSSSLVTVTAIPKGTGTLTVTATATVSEDVYDSIPANNTAKKETAISDTKADLGITLTALPQPVLKGNNLTLEAIVTNEGPDQATGVYIDFTVPLSFSFKSAEGDNLGGECSSSTNATANVIKCPVNPLTTESKTANIRITTIPAEGGNFEVSATVGSEVFDPVLTNNTAQVLKDDKPVPVEVTQFVADVGLTMTLSAEPMVGSPLTYTLSLSNQGPNEATQVTVTHTLPAANQVVYKTATVTPSSGSICYDLNVDRQLVCVVDKLPVNGAATLSIEVQPLVVGNITNTATIKSGEFDSDEKNNTVTNTSYVNNPDTLFFVEAQTQGVGKVEGLRGVISLAVSPDSNQVYAVSFTDQALTVFSRNPSDGRLSWVQTLVDNKDNVDGLEAATDVELSPDGAYVYTTALNDSALSVFKRDALTGKVTWIQTLKDGVTGVEGLGGAFALQVTATQIYVAGSSDDAIAIFNRDSTTGQVTFMEVVSDSKTLDGVNALAVSPDGLQLFAVSANSDSLTIFNRDPNTGKLSLLQTFINNTEGVQGLDAASGVAVSPDNRQVYVTGGGTDNALSVFSRLTDQSTFNFVEVHRDDANGIDGLNGAAGLTLSRDGNYVYVASINDSAVAMFKRDSNSGTLTFLDVVRDQDKDVNGLGGARAVAVTPTGAHLYVAGFADHAIALLRIASSDLKVSLSDSKDPVNIAEPFSYTATVTNNGPNPATNLILILQLSPSLRLLQIPANSPCQLTAEHQVSCKQTLLEVGASLGVTLGVAANDTGEITSEITATANQFDPTPSTVSETTKVVATADLEITQLANPTIITVGRQLTYHLTITNKGPDSATDIKLVSVLPPTVDFVSATAAGNENICQFSSLTREVTCTLATLPVSTSDQGGAGGSPNSPPYQGGAGGGFLINLIVTPKIDGMLTHSVTVSSTAFDPQLPNNSHELSVQVSLNLIEDTYDNSQGELRDYIIAPTGAVVGGNLGGTITNQGLLSEVHILPDTLIINECLQGTAKSEGLDSSQAVDAPCGKLSGTITNEGIIENAQLLSNTVINGGVLRGRIAGFPAAPATLNSKIEDGTTLTNVILAVGCELSAQVILGQGVRFISNATIPAGLDLTGAYPWILEPISQRLSVNLLMDLLVDGESLLATINALPDLKNNGLALNQDTNTGNLWLLLGEDLFVLAPPSVIQAPPETTPGITLNPDGSVIFLTETRRHVIAQPSLHSPEAFQTAMRELGLDKFTAPADGNLIIAPTDQLYFSARPDWQTQSTKLADVFSPLGLTALPTSLIEGLPMFLLHFMEGNGVTSRQQYFYSAPAHQAELQQVLQGIPGVTDIHFYNNGTVTVKIGDRTYTAMFDYMVTKNLRGRVTQLLTVPDRNGDGSNDIEIIYVNGDQQVLFMAPSPKLVEEVQAIPEVQRAFYTVTEDIDGNLMFTSAVPNLSTGQRLKMRVTNVTQIDETTPMSMTLYPDGSGLFITDSGQQLRTQPLVQDLAALHTTARSLGLAGVLEAGNGNLTVPVNTTMVYSTRPGLDSTVTWLTMPLGLQTVPASLPGVAYVVFIFRDEWGNKRQQFIYPAAKEPENLYTFFIKAPGVKSVVLSNDGTITVNGSGDINFRGIFDYVVEARDLPTGGIQFTRIPDANGDDIEDYSLTYGNGKRQLIYRLP